jgi:hypothetical protein
LDPVSKKKYIYIYTKTERQGGKEGREREGKEGVNEWMNGQMKGKNSVLMSLQYNKGNIMATSEHSTSFSVRLFPWGMMLKVQAT